MKRNNGNRVGVALRLTACCLMLLAFAGNAMAQDDPLYVIKKDGHYLAHVYNESTHAWELQNADAFSPNCLWYSGNTVDITGNNHNYYFMDGTDYHFLAAPLQANGALSLSASLPAISLLRNTDQIYYFYDWDPDAYGRGVARGHQHTGFTQETCQYSWDDGQCWEVYWVEYDNGSWELSGSSSYNITPNGARFRGVEVIEHPMVIWNEQGGLNDLTLDDYEMQPGQQQGLSASFTFPVPFEYDFIPAYNQYAFEGTVHYYYNNQDNSTPPGSGHGQTSTDSAYEWTISGEGMYYLSFDETENYVTSNLPNPTIYYNRNNNEGDKTATITLKVTYEDGSWQTKTVSLLLKVECQTPSAPDATVTYEGVTLSWFPTADRYKVYWGTDMDHLDHSVDVGSATSYTITGLAPNTTYYYKVTAFCNNVELTDATVFDFTTKGEPGLMVYGAIFGGGRMADVGKETEVVIINCDSISAVYGGNDIAGSVLGDGSNITLGVNAGETNASYGTTNAPIRIGSVYGGGNGFYAYNGESFEAATSETATVVVAPGDSISNMTPTHHVGASAWINDGTTNDTLMVPRIVKTSITVASDSVRIDSVFGGAKNAFLTAGSGNGSEVKINGGTIFAVFGGNNIGGGQGYGKHYIKVTKTTLNLEESSLVSNQYGRGFGIRYLFGGGNKVAGSTTDVHIEGGQCDTIFGGGNLADVYLSNVTVNCTLGEKSTENEYTFGNTFTNAIDYNNYSTGVIDENTLKPDYDWNGYDGIYNVRTLFGGNNMANMTRVPTITLTSGSVGTVYGGGNEGDMLAQTETNITVPKSNGIGDEVVTIKYGTHVVMDSPTILIDYLYGGCQRSNVDYSSWTEIKDGHVGVVYGGCNISGDVGSTKINPDNNTPRTLEYQAVQGGAYVIATGGFVYKSLFGGSNGFYHCNNGINYVEGVDYGDPGHHYIGLPIPTHNETQVAIRENATVYGNVYAGGNMSPVGFTNNTVGNRPFAQFVGWASVRMDGGRVDGSLYGGGNMASILGSNEARISGGVVNGNVYGGNDRSGQAGQISNRVLPEGYDKASDGLTSLTYINTFVKITGKPWVNTVYGGGNGDYDYEGGSFEYCTTAGQPFDDKPIQQYTFVDINVDDEGHVSTVYGGGNGVTVTGGITVFLNVKDPVYGHDHVDTIFGGNNKDNVVDTDNVPMVPEIILLHGQVGTVYGGCNKGAMTTGKDFTFGGQTYHKVGSMVRMRDVYEVGNQIPTAVVSESVYGGCRMNDVTYNTLVLVERGNHTATLFGGCDISGAVGDTSRVVVNRLTADAPLGTSTIFGGGNGNYIYGTGEYEGNVYIGEDLVASGNTKLPPTSEVSLVDILSGQVGTSTTPADVYGGGFGQPTKTTGNVFVNIGPATATSWTGLPVIYGDVYGGAALGDVNTDDLSATNATTTTTVNFNNGTLHGDLYGGALGQKQIGDDPNTAIPAKVYGKVFVNISNEDQPEDNCFIDLREANVYGCNNANGSPQDSVYVNVWKTAYNYNNYTTGDIYKASYNESDAQYAIDQVFGGGHEADYAPKGGADSKSKTMVYIHGCLNTIRRVFSGGDAAAAVGVVDTIQGGRMDFVFGGGNGEVTSANIGKGGTNLVVLGGTMAHLFGGSNKTGDIAGPMYTEVTDGSGCPQNIGEFFGGSNEAVLNATSGVYSQIKCGAGTIGEAYGGSKLASIEGDVTLDVMGGSITSVFGGSKGVQDGTAANIDGSVTLNLLGGTINQAYGGTNNNGNITGLIQVNVLDTVHNCGLGINDVYGGGRLASYTPTFGSGERIAPEVNVIHGTVNNVVYGGGWGAPVNGASPKVTIGDNNSEHRAIVGSNLNGTTTPGYGIVFGGGDMAFVEGNTLVVYDDNNPDSQVHFIFGGGNQAGIGGNIVVNMNQGRVIDTIFGGCNVTGNVGGKIEVTVNGGTSGTVIGGGNLAAYSAPSATPDYPYVHVVDGTVTGSVIGGGNKASVTGNPKVQITGGTVADKVVGGGNEAGVAGNPYVFVEGGTIGTSTEAGAGVYGGCNITGEVTGNTNVTLVGGTIGESETNTANIHGGGYGQPTNVTGNVLVNFGAIAFDDLSGEEIQEDYPMLYGELYGGSAFGNVNTNASNSTIVNLLNGTINGAAYGGGLGDKASQGTGHSDVEAKVYGVVHVNVGNATDPDNIDTYSGMATLIDCDIYGCNNLNGSPLDNVYVDVYKTAHIHTNEAAYIGAGLGYAIDEVFGGGNEADFYNASVTTDKKTYVYIHKCENTIRRLFGGGNAAYVPGVYLTIDGGRLFWVFGGGNGELGADHAANIGAGGINIHLGGGRIELLVNGSNEHGDVLQGGTITNTVFDGCQDAVVVDHFMGANQTTIYGDITETIPCGTDFKFVNLYCGSNLAQIYGNINLTIQGGVFENVFGGSKGSFENTSLPQPLQTYSSCIHDNPSTSETEGHVNLLIEGGTIGNLFGGCDINGNVDGKITITVNSADNATCPLFIGNIYGAGNHTDYTPVNINNGSGSTFSPEIKIIKGIIGGTSPLDAQGHGLLPVLNPGYLLPAAEYEGNVFGGGNLGNVTGNPKVIIGEKTNTNKVEIRGSVFGGGNEGNVNGSPQVIIVPEE